MAPSKAFSSEYPPVFDRPLPGLSAALPTKVNYKNCPICIFSFHYWIKHITIKLYLFTVLILPNVFHLNTTGFFFLTLDHFVPMNRSRARVRIGGQCVLLQNYLKIN